MKPPRQTVPATSADQIIAEALKARAEREQGYREQALKLYPWVCARCAREFSGARLRELTVHHRNHNHDENPADGSNWELLCIYCHDNEHARQLESAAGGDPRTPTAGDASHRPFAGLDALLKSGSKK